MLACVHGVRHQHGVVDRGNGDAKACEDLGVVFHVLADFQNGIVFQQRFQQGQHHIAGQLPFGQGHSAQQVIGAGAVQQGDIGGLARIDTQRDPHNLGLHLIQTGGFGIHRQIAPRISAADPSFQSVGIADAGIGGRVKGQGLRLRGVMRACHFKALACRQNRRVNLQLFRHAPDQGLKLHLSQKGHNRFRLWRAQLEAVQINVNRRVVFQRH